MGQSGTTLGMCRLERGADLAAVRSMLHRLERQGRIAAASVLMTFVPGASWPGKRRNVNGYVGEQCKCGAVVTELHRLWGS